MQLEVWAESAAELRSLQGWLRSDPDVRRTATVGVRGSAPRPGEMGTAVDVLQLVTGNGWSAASFVLAVVAWRQTRPRRPRVEIRRGDTVVVLDGGTSDVVEQVIRALDTAPDEGGGR
ncbi:hypothetical protein RCO28_36645 [Streptomyces sp. LHD-70]|uniref:effector-associated constant component EACC1 n=1 Tax=Streptomyces sp. LHD-70 TaxID=3072140 RepID=UPI00280EBC36|nr:hypothetical protein [Streptomyces sp. LHD-70]MDQ8707956.1 hypothetical protein [Streptomyces sp. LHD-70]